MPKFPFVSQITEVMSPRARLIIRRPEPSKEVLFSGCVRDVPAELEARTVVWLHQGWHSLTLNIE